VSVASPLSQPSEKMSKALAASFKDAGNKALTAQNFDLAIAAYTKVSARAPRGPPFGRAQREAAQRPPTRTKHTQQSAVPTACFTAFSPPRPPQAIEADPTDHVFFSNRSAAHLSKGDVEEALQDAEACIKLSPAWAKGYGRKGAALHAMEMYDEAVQAFEEGLAVDPSNAALTDGMREAKEAELKAGMRAGPGSSPFGAGGDPFGSDMLARIARNPRFAPYLADEAFKAKLSAIASSPNGMQVALQGAMGGDGRMKEVVSFLLGVDLDSVMKGRGEGGMDEDAPAGGARQAAPAPAAAPRAKAAPAPLEKHEPEEVDDGLTDEQRAAKVAAKAAAAKKKEAGNAAYKARNFAEASALYAAASELDPEDINININSAAVQMETGDYDGAVATCLAAIDRGREVHAPYASIAKAYLRAGNAHAKAGRLQEAIDAYERSLLEQRTDEAGKKVKEARAELKKRAEEAYLDPVKGAEAKERGNVAFKDGDFAKAVAEYSEAIKREPGNTVYWCNRASAKAKLMDFNGALEDANRSLKIDPTYAKAACRKGNCQYGLQEYHKALDTFKAVLEADKANVEAQEGMRRTVEKINSSRGSAPAGPAGADAEAERHARSMSDPEIQAILRDPMVNSAIEDMQVRVRVAPAHAPTRSSHPCSLPPSPSPPPCRSRPPRTPA